MRYRLFLAGILLILAGAFLAHKVQTSGGTSVTEARWPADKGVVMSGLLYVPAGVDATHPAPAVLISHGYINTREMQSPFAIELSRRGFVVLAMDMTGHGQSGGNVGADGFGGPAALAWLRKQPLVDPDNIGMEGHSLGGAPVIAAATALPDGYRSIVLEGSTLGLFGQPGEGTPTFPRNLSLVFGRYDEFASMWQQTRGSDVPHSARLQKMFGTERDVVVGKAYGDAAAGTARILHIPPVTHPWEHFSQAGIGHAVDWFQTTLSGEKSPRDPMDQIWIWKEVGTLVAFVGLIVLMLGTFQLALSIPGLSSLKRPLEPSRAARGSGGWIALVLTALIPALTFFPFMKLGMVFLPQPLFPQWVHNQILVWAALNGLITIVLGVLFRRGRPAFTNDWVRSIAISLITVGVGYLSLALVDQVFKVDYRFWVLGLKPLDGPHWAMFATYAPIWVAYYLVALRALCGNLSVEGEGAGRAYLTAILALAGGFGLLLSAEYGSLFATGLLLTPKEPLSTIVAIQFVPLLTVVGIISVFTWRRTNSFVPAGLICGLLIAWYITGGTATHWSAEFPLKIPGVSKAK